MSTKTVRATAKQKEAKKAPGSSSKQQSGNAQQPSLARKSDSGPLIAKPVFSHSTDKYLKLANQIREMFGVTFTDNRASGGALWVHHNQEGDKVANILNNEKFRFHKVRGWWFK